MKKDAVYAKTALVVVTTSSAVVDQPGQAMSGTSWFIDDLMEPYLSSCYKIG